MRKLFIALSLFSFLFCQAQKKFNVVMKGKDTVSYSMMCPIDTVKGVIYFQGDHATVSIIASGYFIAPCGGVRIGPFYEVDAPVFIPAFFIRNDEIVNGKRLIHKYQRQENNGYFTDEKFKRLDINSVYGLLVTPKK